jgi:hypothetical protein
MLSWEGQQIMGQAAIIEKLNVSLYVDRHAYDGLALICFSCRKELALREGQAPGHYL